MDVILYTSNYKCGAIPFLENACLVGEEPVAMVWGSRVGDVSCCTPDELDSSPGIAASLMSFDCCAPSGLAITQKSSPGRCSGLICIWPRWRRIKLAQHQNLRFGLADIFGPVGAGSNELAQHQNLRFGLVFRAPARAF